MPLYHRENLTEKELFSAISVQDAPYLSVLSFKRLCDILEDAYGGRVQTSVSSATSALLMWQNIREAQGLRRKRIHKAGGKASKTSVAESRIDLASVNFFK